ncbi:MAG: gas vesicle protein GvpN [Chloroflexi bacterium]|nr:gas vesicle protein GvpN [Chloroflexota bacterium]
MAMEGVTTVLEPRPLPNFVETPFVRSVVERALTYLAAGFPVHFRGASGTGKTTLAMHVASKLGRPVVMIHGDEEFSTSDLVGGEHGYRTRKVIDNFIHSVLKTEEDTSRHWMDNRLTVACRYGFTLIYDEFTRSRPEANNALLSVLQEKMLDLPSARDGGNYLRVHPNFTAIFTSNPEEYAGVYRSQDALRDRMVTLDLETFDEETEVAITVAKSGISPADAQQIVRVVRGLRGSGVCEFAPTIRGCIMVARAMRVRDSSVERGDGLFRQVCVDILASESSRVGSKAQALRVKEVLGQLVDAALDGQSLKVRELSEAGKGGPL